MKTGKDFSKHCVVRINEAYNMSFKEGEKWSDKQRGLYTSFYRSKIYSMN